jgi:adenylyltransferase/sulfurtransferase
MPWNPHDPQQVARYSRQLLLAEVGPQGQAALGTSTVLVVGAGGLGAPVLAYLAAAGVGRLIVVDGDTVDATNLHRQLLYTADDVGRSKPLAARPRLEKLGPWADVQVVTEPLSPFNARDLVRGVTVAVDATDSFPARFALNDACRLEGVPLVHGGVTRFGGLVTTFAPGGPCYRCFFPEPPTSGRIPGCGEEGVHGPAVGVIGSLQALEAVKLIVGALDRALIGRLLAIDLWAPSFEAIALPIDPACPLCGDYPDLTDLDPADPVYRAAP